MCHRTLCSGADDIDDIRFHTQKCKEQENKRIPLQITRKCNKHIYIEHNTLCLYGSNIQRDSDGVEAKMRGFYLFENHENEMIITQIYILQSTCQITLCLFRTDSAQNLLNKMETEDAFETMKRLVLERRSVRKYLNKEIPVEELREVLALAQV